jgi:hypothetical protein
MSREKINVPFQPRNAHTVSVTLSDEVLAQVMVFAARIEEANRKRKRKNKQGMTAKGKESLAKRMMGYAGEAALAQYLGLPPARMSDDWRERPDVLCFDCITTDKAHGALIVTPRDRLDMMKVLVIDRSPVFHICGWYLTGDARLEAQRSHSEWWRTEREHGGAWYIPAAFLRPLHDEEAQRALARHHRSWDGTRYVAQTSAERFAEDYAQMKADIAAEEDALAKLPPSLARTVRPDFTETDWREVLRRAGAAPPEEKSNA